jgi:serine/threonine protein kinase
LIHRDIKPANIMLCERGGYFDFVKVLDYGLARSFTDENDSLTRDGIVHGTPGYIAPERLAGNEDLRGDIFSLGMVGYFFLTGEPAFPGSDTAAGLQEVLHKQPSPVAVTNQTVPQPLEDLIHRCLATGPANRPANLSEVLVELVTDWPTVSPGDRQLPGNAGKRSQPSSV